MKRSWCVYGLCVVTLLVGARLAWADAEGDALAAALAKAPPSQGMTEARQKAVAAMDAWIARPRSERLEPVIRYYNAAVDRVLNKLETEKITSGLRIFQLYSSGVIVQTPETVFAFDLNEGPQWRKWPANFNPEAEAAEMGPDSERRGRMIQRMKQAEEQLGNGPRFVFSEEQEKRFVALIDYSFHTHQHGDHISRQLSEALLKAGKTVVVTESNRASWKRYPWAEKLTVLEQTVQTPQTVGPLKVDVLWDHQWNNLLHESGTPCDAFVVTTPGGLAVMTKGDTNCGLQLLGWLTLLKERGQKIDVVVGSVIFWKGVPVLPQWSRLFTPLFLPGHTWEFGHRNEDQPQGNCNAYLQAWGWAREGAAPEKANVLTWGESIDIPAR